MTAVQMVIDVFYKYRYDNSHLIELFNVAIDKEKEQIEDAYNQGFRDALDFCGNDINYKDEIAEQSNAENYYNKTFKK
jgi:hypothetical protein